MSLSWNHFFAKRGVLGIIILLEHQEGMCAVLVVIIDGDHSLVEDLYVLVGRQVANHAYELTDTIRMNSTPCDSFIRTF
jgi:hypothetical protein